ncbi:MAG: Rrf2 family transcriptional regulator [Bacteroidales bacterium]
MKFNTKVRYGLRCMIELAMADPTKGMLQKEISRKQQISRKYLDQIIFALKSTGLIENSAGRGSGYKIGKQAEKSTVYDIYRSFESELAVVDGLDEDETKNHCYAAREYWIQLNEHIKDHMKSVSLNNLKERQIQFSQQTSGLDYVI